MSNKSLLKSLLTTDNPFNTTEEVMDWIARRNREVAVKVEQVPFRSLKGWHFDDETGNLCHDSGKFFSIIGVDVFADNGVQMRWMQPLINQPEVGYLGIICRECDGVLYFLLQAKIDPGNVHCVQLSPTLQATRSNYTQVHGGKRPAYLDYFKNARSEQIALDQLQSEQGAITIRGKSMQMTELSETRAYLEGDFDGIFFGE